MKYSWLLSISIGVLLSGCAVNVAPKGSPQSVLMPNYRKPNPTAGSKGVAVANVTPSISLGVDGNGYIYYRITDYNNQTGGTHGTQEGKISTENKSSDLFSTQFPNGIKAKTIRFGSSNGEVEVSGERHTWVSAQNTLLDDDVTWVKKQ